MATNPGVSTVVVKGDDVQTLDAALKESNAAILRSREGSFQGLVFVDENEMPRLRDSLKGQAQVKALNTEGQDPAPQPAVLSNLLFTRSLSSRDMSSSICEFQSFLSFDTLRVPRSTSQRTFHLNFLKRVHFT